MTVITRLEVLDVRFPTSRRLDGSDAMNPDPDYSAAYVVAHTDAGDGLAGHGLTFTIGEGTEVVCAAIRALESRVVGRDTAELFADMGGLWRRLASGQIRWIGPQKGAIHLALAAIVNAMWDLYAKTAGKPLWKLLVDMSPAELVSVCDFQYVTDALTPGEAVALLEAKAAGKAEREAEMQEVGLPTYTTSSGWLGYDDDKLRRLTRQALAAGWTHVKLKVGADIESDIRRCRIVREELGRDATLMLDANQVWDVDEAIAHMARLAEFDPHWIEEPTSPDDILGHATIARAIAPVRVATGEQVHNRVVFKQLLQAGAIGFCQIDVCRLGGVNEAVLVMLLVAKYGVPVCPHAGGVGLCEYVQHLSLVDYIAITGDLTDVAVEYIDHLHEHFVDPVTIRDARYMPPARPGYSAEMHRSSLAAYSFPDGPAWAASP